MTDEEKKKVTEAEHVRELMQHPGMGIIRARMAQYRSELFGRWLRASPDEAEKMRQQTRNEEAFFNQVKAILLQGKAAQMGGNNPSEKSEQGE